MKPSLVRLALQVVEEALGFPVDIRQEFVRQSCAGDENLLREVDSLLVFDRGVSIEGIEQPDEPDLVVSLDSTDRFELIDELGRGGMGTVFRAHDHHLDCEVAVKVLHKNASDRASMQRRFAAEAHIGAKLQHPGVAPVYDLGRLPDGRIFFAMKLVAGKTLSSILSARNKPAEHRSRLLTVFAQQCQTIAYAHSRGIIHRDLKPENVMVGEFGEVQVMDWGIATSVRTGVPERVSRVDHEGRNDSLLDSSSIHDTRFGVIVGTPAYMPPEQAAGRRDTQTDVFSLGAILCEILTGQPPYVAASPAEVFAKSVNAELQDAFDRLDRCGVDSEILTLTKNCLQPASGDRPPNAEYVASSMAAHLQAVQDRLHSSELASARAETKVHEERKRRFLLAALTATGFSLVFILLASWVWYSAERVRHTEALMEVEHESASVLESQVYRLQISAAFTEFQAENYARASHVLENTSPEQRNWEWHYLRSRLDQSIQFFPLSIQPLAAVLIDSQRRVLALDEHNVAHVWDRASGKKVSETSGKGHFIALGPSGHCVLSYDDHPLLWDAFTGELLREFPDWPQPNHFSEPRWNARGLAAISENGKHIAFVSDKHLHLFDGQTGELLRAFPIESGLCCARFSADGRWLLWADGNTVHFWDIHTGQKARPEIVGTSNVNPGSLAITSDKSRVAMTTQDHAIVWNLASGKSRRLNINKRRTSLVGTFVCFSEDGSRLVTITEKDALRVWDSNDGTLLRTLCRQPANMVSAGATSYAEDCIALPGKDGVRVWDVRDRSPLKLEGHTSFVYPVEISPDDRRIASGGWDQTVRSWDIETGRELWASSEKDGSILDLDFDEKGERLVSGSSSGVACIRDARSGKLIHKIKVDGQIDGARFFGSDSILLVHGAISLHDAQSLVLKQQFKADEQFYLGRDKQSDRFVTRSPSQWSSPPIHTVSLWDVDQPGPYAEFRTPHLVTSAAFTPDGRQLILGDQAGKLSVWDAKNPDQPLRIIPAHSREIFALEFLGDQTRLLSGGRDSIIRIWDFASGDMVGFLQGHDDYVYSLAASSDGERVISGSGDHTVRIWESSPLRERLRASSIAGSAGNHASDVKSLTIREPSDEQSRSD